MMTIFLIILCFGRILAVMADHAIKTSDVISCHGIIYNGREVLLAYSKVYLPLKAGQSTTHEKINIPSNTYPGNNFVSFDFGRRRYNCPGDHSECQDVMVANGLSNLVGVGTVCPGNFFPCEVISQ